VARQLDQADLAEIGRWEPLSTSVTRAHRDAPSATS
jgi:hypothetical protein